LLDAKVVADVAVIMAELEAVPLAEGEVVEPVELSVR
jgi:hypothetical protein